MSVKESTKLLFSLKTLFSTLVCKMVVLLYKKGLI